jgi:hypothetical protein
MLTPTPSQNLARIGHFPGQHLICTAPHGFPIHIDVHHVVRGNLYLSVNNTGLHWRSCQLTWLRANKRQAARCCCDKRGTRTGRLVRKDTSLNLFLTVWSDTVTPVTLLGSCCSSLAVAERRRNVHMVRYRSSCGVVMFPRPCPTLLVNRPVSS